MKRIHLFLTSIYSLVLIGFCNFNCQGQYETHASTISSGQNAVQANTIISLQRAEKLYVEAMEQIKNGTPKQAIQTIERIIYHSAYAPLELHFFAGRAFHLDTQFYKAIKHYEQYKTRLKSDIHQDELDHVNHLIAQAQYAFELSYESKDHTLTSLQTSLDHPFSKQKYLMISPTSNQVYFAEPSATQKHHVDIYSLPIHNSTGMCKQKMNLQLPKNLRPLQFYHQGKALLLIHIVSSRFYTVTYQNNAWSSPVKMKHQPNLGIVSSASISDDGTKIIYSRVFPNCDMDLFSITQTAGKWSKPQSLTMNSYQQECFPNLTADGQTLYFSSGSQKSIGGFDIMVSHFNPETQTWSEAKNLGFQINTPYDELQFAIHPNGKSGVLLADHRQKGEKQTLYFFEQGQSACSLLQK